MRYLLFVLLMVVVAGCSGLQSSPAMQVEIDSLAVSTKLALTGENPSVEVQNSAVGFKKIYDSSTMNTWEYWFNEAKQVLASAPIYEVVLKKYAMAKELALRAEAGEISSSNLSTVLTLEYQFAVNTKYQLMGEKTPNDKLVSIALIKVEAAKSVGKRAANTDLQSLIDTLPSEELKIWVKEYGVSLLRLGIAQADLALKALIEGDKLKPYEFALSGMTEEELILEATNLLSQDISVTNANASNVETQRNAAKALCTLGISLLVALLGV